MYLALFGYCYQSLGPTSCSNLLSLLVEATSVCFHNERAYCVAFVFRIIKGMTKLKGSGCTLSDCQFPYHNGLLSDVPLFKATSHIVAKVRRHQSTSRRVRGVCRWRCMRMCREQRIPNGGCRISAPDVDGHPCVETK